MTKALALSYGLILIIASFSIGQPISVPACDSGEPCVEFTSVPPYNSSENLEGRVGNLADPTAYKVCTYIRVEGVWFVKPDVQAPCVPIQADGRWEADITAPDSNDPQALEITSFLLPQADVPEQNNGHCRLPDSLSVYPRAMADRTGERRSVFFSSREWKVKDVYWGPGPNHFSDHAENVEVDEQGQLHLRITERDGRWFSAEVVSRDVMGYGTYIFSLASRVDQLDKNVVFGLFTWDSDACNSPAEDAMPFNNEIDIEFSRFGQLDAQNSQYAVQPYQTCDLFRFNMPEIANSTHIIDWQPGRIRFVSLQGANIIESHDFTDVTCMPTPLNGNTRMNLWLLNSEPPSNGQSAEVIIRDFIYIPMHIENF